MTAPFSYFTDDDLDDFISMQNTNYVSMRDWQIRAINFFKEANHKAIFECATGFGKSRVAIVLIKYLLNKEP